MLRIQRLLNDHPEYVAQLIGQVHDELLLYCSGKAWINWDKSEIKDGLYTKLKFDWDEQATNFALKIKEIMERVQTEIFTALGSEITGSSSYAIAPVWAH